MVKKTFLRRTLERVFPAAPDFFSMLTEQSALAVESLNFLSEFMLDADPSKAMRVRELEHRGDDLKHRNMDELNRSFATPMDREDIFRAIVSVDDILGYAKTTVREMEILDVTADVAMQQMTNLLRSGVESLHHGYSVLAHRPQDAEADATIAHKTERAIEKVYRQAVADLFDERQIAELIQSDGDQAIVSAITHIVHMLRRRELYRHLSNAADRVEVAAETLHDIVVKIV